MCSGSPSAAVTVRPSSSSIRAGNDARWLGCDDLGPALVGDLDELSRNRDAALLDGNERRPALLEAVEPVKRRGARLLDKRQPGGLLVETHGAQCAADHENDHGATPTSPSRTASSSVPVRDRRVGLGLVLGEPVAMIVVLIEDCTHPEGACPVDVRTLDVADMHGSRWIGTKLAQGALEGRGIGLGDAGLVAEHEGREVTDDPHVLHQLTQDCTGRESRVRDDRKRHVGREALDGGPGAGKKLWRVIDDTACEDVGDALDGIVLERRAQVGEHHLRRARQPRACAVSRASDGGSARARPHGRSRARPRRTRTLRSRAPG